MSIYSFLIELNQKKYNPKNILDIGANVGHFSSFCSNVWLDSYIYMIEGNRNCEEHLQKLPFDYKIALLSDAIKKVIFYISENNNICTGSSYYREIDYKNPIEECRETETLDNLISEKFDLIKIDTQGSELDILKGGDFVIRNADMVIIELSIKPYNVDSPLCDEIISYMKYIGFSEYSIIDEHVWLNENHERYSVGEVFQIDVVFYNDNFNLRSKK